MCRHHHIKLPQRALLVLLCCCIFSFCCAQVFFSSAAAAAWPSNQQQQQQQQRARQTSDGLFVFNDANFEAEAKTKAILAVLFHAPWCGVCKQLRPEFGKAARELAKHSVYLGVLDATSVSAEQSTEQQQQQSANAADGTPASEQAKEDFVPGVKTAHKYGVTTFPTVLVFHYGKHNPTVPKIPRHAEGIVEVLYTMARASSVDLHSVQEVKDAIRANSEKRTIVIGFYADAAKAHNFADLGESYRGLLYFFNIKDQKVIDYFPSFFHNNFVIFRYDDNAGDLVAPATKALAQKYSKLGFHCQDGFELETLFVLSGEEGNKNRPRTKLPPASRIIPFDGSDRNENFGQPGFERDKIVHYISSHAFSSIGILTPRNRHLYNSRNETTVYMFLVFDVEAALAGGGGGGGGACSSSSNEDEFGNEAKGCEGAGANSDENSLDSTKASKKPRSSPSSLPSQLLYYANRFRKAVRRNPQYASLNFLFVNPNENAQMFRAFGFQYSSLYNKPDKESKAKSVVGMANNNMIGVTKGKRKYRYPYDYFDVELLERFLKDVYGEKINPFVKSSREPETNAKPGDGGVTVLVYDNIDRLVKRDDKRDSLVAFVSPYEELSKRALASLDYLAAKERGNTRLLIGAYDGMHNDPPVDMEYAALPTIRCYTPKHKSRLRANDDASLSTRAGAMKEVKKKQHSGSEHTATTTPTSTSSSYLEYKGDFSVRSVATFLQGCATVPLLNTIVGDGR